MPVSSGTHHSNQPASSLSVPKRSSTFSARTTSGQSSHASHHILHSLQSPISPADSLLSPIHTPSPGTTPSSPTHQSISLLIHRIKRIEDLSLHLNRRLPKPVDNLTLCIQHLKILLKLTETELDVYVRFAELSQCMTHLNASLLNLEQFLESIMNASVLLKARFNKPLKKLTKALEQNVVMFGMVASYLKASVGVDAVRRLSVVSGFPQFDLIDTSDTHSVVNQADAHYFGHGVTQDYHAAYRLYMSAAEHDHARAQYIVGKMSLEGVGVDGVGDGVQETGIRFLLKACEQEYPDALNFLGELHSEGRYSRVPKDARLAVKYFFKAAQAGHLEGMCNLAQYLMDGEGIKQDYNFAIQWLRKAVERNYPRALNQLGKLYYQGVGVEQRDYNQAVDLLKRAAEQKYCNAFNSLGVAYEEGNGVIKDLDMAASFYEKSKEQGNVNAYNNLGYVKLLQKKFLEGKQLLLTAADMGNIDALHNLGLVYQQGLGVSIDIPRAFQYFSKAAESDHYGACTRVADILFSGTENGEISPDTKKAYEYYYKAATGGNDPDAQNSLGILFEEGISVRKDAKEAFKWYKLAVKTSHRRHAQALYNLASMYIAGAGCKENPARAASLFEEAARLGHLKAKEVILTFGEVKANRQKSAAGETHVTDRTPSKSRSHVSQIRRDAPEEPPLDDSNLAFVSPIRKKRHHTDD